MGTSKKITASILRVSWLRSRVFDSVTTESYIARPIVPFRHLNSHVTITSLFVTAI